MMTFILLHFLMSSFILISSLALEFFNDTHLASASKKKLYYNQSGYHFLQHYGGTYDLFSTFIEENKTKLSYPKESFTESISKSFKIQNYNNHNHRSYLEIADRNKYSEDFNISKEYYTMEEKNSFEYVPEEDRMDSYYYNNRLRYGPGLNDRFLNIVFHKDPWVNEDAEIVFIGEESSGALGERSDFASCNFSYPVKASSLYIRGRLNSCPIPREIFTNLTRHHSEIVFDLVTNDGILLKNIRLRRLNPLDRRFFNVSCSMMTYTLEDHVVYEYILYHLMMGVEHFYIYDNRRIYPPRNGSSHSANHFKLWTSILRPFLDANLVTLIYYPYLPSKISGAMDTIQACSITAVMQQFGHYNKFISLFDYDEFYLPSENFHHRLSYSLQSSTTFISSVLQTLVNYPKSQRYPSSSDEPIDAVNFNTVDMGCDEKDTIEQWVNQRKRLGSITQAAVTHCNKEGVAFIQYAKINGTFIKTNLPFPDSYLGRGKCFFVPDLNPSPETPHFSENGMLGTEEYGGVVCHYTNFRLSVMATGTEDSSQWLYKREKKNSCHDFTLKMLRLFVRLTSVKSITGTRQPK